MAEGIISRGFFFFICLLHTNNNLPWCSIHCWSLPSFNITWFSTLAGLFLLFIWNRGNGFGWSVVLVCTSGITSSRNCSATSPSSSIRRPFAYHVKPWMKEIFPKVNKHAIISILQMTKTITTFSLVTNASVIKCVQWKENLQILETM